MRGRRNTILPHRNTARGGDFGAYFSRGQNAAMARLGALAELEFHHFHLIQSRHFREAFRRKTAIRIARAEIAGTDFPNQIATCFTVIGAKPAFARIMRKAAALRPLV